MRLIRFAGSGLVALLLGASLLTATADAQVTGGHQSSGCTQQQGGGGGAGQILQPGDRSQAGRQLVLAGLIAAALQNTQVVGDVTALNNALNNVQLSVVCLNDVLNQNDIALVENVLNNSPILSNNRDVLSNNQILTDFLNNNNIAANVEVLSVDLLSGTVFLLAQ
jgi:hypothetical protein